MCSINDCDDSLPITPHNIIGKYLGIPVILCEKNYEFPEKVNRGGAAGVHNKINRLERYINNRYISVRYL